MTGQGAPEFGKVPGMTVKRWVMMVFGCSAMIAGGQSVPPLQLTVSGETLGFQLDSFDLKEIWLLQYSPDAVEWSDLVFLEGGPGAVGFGAQFTRQALPDAVADRAFFRAAGLAEVDPAYRDYLAARLRWRAAALSSYRYVVSTSNGLGGSVVRYTVENGTVTTVEVLSDPPPIFPVPTDLTIDDWFDEVAAAFEADAALVDVDWNAETGYPSRAYLDFDAQVADEEMIWTISEFVPLD